MENQRTEGYKNPSLFVFIHFSLFFSFFLTRSLFLSTLSSSPINLRAVAARPDGGATAPEP
jgi:hypothetical protein